MLNIRDTSYASKTGLGMTGMNPWSRQPTSKSCTPDRQVK